MEETVTNTKPPPPPPQEPEEMFLYLCSDHAFDFPHQHPGAAILAHSEEEARKLLDRELAELFLETSATGTPYHLMKVPLKGRNESKAFLFMNGLV